ncbi:hypothetical protein FSO04_42770 [Paraburkholderia madseniana]|uniref:Uncharacterized protein n=1 Tax=Paraburkholderia madseniana TaxID=2599607 RepID=A0A6N6VZR2_9BURK|nr:hypothetical protein [Paraburkholderia madseniana]KAE8753875.1 hypothetical protein FSO04_42770 [Paraburkholderia madseniana]
MPVRRLKFGQFEIYVVTGGTDASLSLDDMARPLGFDCKDGLLGKISELGLDDEVYPVGAKEMISVGAARTLAGSFATVDSAALVDWFDTEPHLRDLPIDCHGPTDQEHRGPQTRIAVEQLLDREPNASTEKIAEDLRIGEQAATDQVKAVHFIRRYKPKKE